MTPSHRATRMATITAGAVLAAGLLASPAQAQCAGGAQKLALSGLCPAEAATRLGTPSQAFRDGLKAGGCKGVAAEATFPGDQALLYWSASCGDGPTRLEVQGGAHQALIVATGGGFYGPVGQEIQVAGVIGADASNPARQLLAWVHDEMRELGAPQVAIDACKAYRATKFAKDAWVVDAPKGYQTSQGRMRDCGTFGYLDDTVSFWRVFGGHSWYFDLGQDAFLSYDAATLTLVPRKTGAAPAQPAGNAAASGNSGTTNIAGGASPETYYGKARSYVVVAGGNRASGTYCAAERNFGGSVLRIGYDGGQWQLAVPYEAPRDDWQGQLEIDGRKFFASGTRAKGWSFVWLGLQELEAIKAGRQMILDIGHASLDFTLDGSTAAILKVAECEQAYR